MENMFKGLLNENDAQTNVFRKQAKVKIARAKAKHIVQTTAKITFNSKQKFCVQRSLVSNWKRRFFVVMTSYEIILDDDFKRLKQNSSK